MYVRFASVLENRDTSTIQPFDLLVLLLSPQLRPMRVAVIAAVIGLGCGAGKDTSGSVSLTDSGGSTDQDTTTGIVPGDDSSTVFDVNEDTNIDSKLTSDAACAKSTVAASRPPVDVIVAVDTSGSMQEESANVQNNINKMSDFLKASGVDYRVVMIAQPPNPLFPPGFIPSVCVPPPLGGASCASNPPLYRQVVQTVGSTDALKVILSTYDSAGKWNDFLRADAFKAFIVVTDDNATSPTPDPIANTFDAELLKRGSGTFGTATKRKYIFYPICGASDADPTKTCGSGMVNNGQTYVDLAKLTGGRTFELCSKDFGPAFSGVGKGLAAAVACEILVPKPPPGETFDPTKVNVTYTPSTGTPVLIEQDASKPCDGGANGWQYNADKTKILLCGDACAKLKADTTAKITVELGCATKVKPPM
jgi:hypothetical protein